MRRHAMLNPGGIDDYRLCTSFKNILKIFYFGPKSTPTQPLTLSANSGILYAWLMARLSTVPKICGGFLVPLFEKLLLF